MPGKKGQKMSPRRSVSKKFHSVKALVFSLFESNPSISKDEVEKIIKKEYPTANFIGKNGRSGHFTWYKHKWNRMKLENANFNIKEAHPKAEKVEAPNESASHESKKDPTANAEDVVKEPMGKGHSRGKGGRIPIQSKKGRVDIKTGKATVQRKGNPKSS